MNDDYKKMQAMLAKVKALTVEEPVKPANQNGEYSDGAPTASPTIPKLFKMTPSDALKTSLIEVFLPSVFQGVRDTGITAWSKLINVVENKASNAYNGYFTDYSSRYSYSTPYVSNAAASQKPGRYKGFLSIADITFSNSAEADRVLGEMKQVICDTGRVTCLDFFNIRKQTPPTYTSGNWGWFDLSNSHVRRNDNTYIIDLQTIQALR